MGESQFRREPYTVVLFICTYFVVIGMYCIENDSPLRGLCTYSTLYYRECLMHICTLHRFTLSGKCMPYMSPINSFFVHIRKRQKTTQMSLNSGIVWFTGRVSSTEWASAKLFLQSSELGLPQTLTRRRVSPPTPGSGGEGHTR